MIKTFAAAAAALALALVAPTSLAGSSSCGSTSCSVSIDDDLPGALYVNMNSTYIYMAVYYNNWNYVRSCYIYPSDANFDKVARVASALTAAPATSYYANFSMTFASSSSTCTGATLTWYR